MRMLMFVHLAIWILFYKTSQETILSKIVFPSPQYVYQVNQ